MAANASASAAPCKLLPAIAAGKILLGRPVHPPQPPLGVAWEAIGRGPTWLAVLDQFRRSAPADEANKRRKGARQGGSWVLPKWRCALSKLLLVRPFVRPSPCTGSQGSATTTCQHLMSQCGYSAAHI